MGNIETDESMRWDVIYSAPTRTAIVTGARSEREVAAYLPDNYRVTAVWPNPRRVTVSDDANMVTGLQPATRAGDIAVEIRGTDVAGWTLDDYVIPRLASGLMHATETT